MKMFVLAALTTLLSAVSFAQSYAPNYGGPSYYTKTLENRVADLEQNVSYLNQRLLVLERNSHIAPTAPAQPRKPLTCMITDDFGKVYASTGSTPIDASSNALKACDASVNSIYCSETKVVCDDPTKTPLTGAVCSLNDDFKKNYKGQGDTLLQAEFQARKNCQTSTNPIYCKGAVKCDTY